jgi:hypothetical protein
MAKQPPLIQGQGQGIRDKGQGQPSQPQQLGAGVPPIPVAAVPPIPVVAVPPVPVALPLPTYLLYSEAVELLVEKGGLRVTEARRMLERIRLAPTTGSFRKWHYRDVLAKAEELRNDPEARA